MTMFDILNPVYKKYKENKKKQMEKELLSKSFSGNIDSDLLLPKESKENAIDVKESKSVKQRFQEQFMLELKKVDFFYNQNLNKVIRPKIKGEITKKKQIFLDEGLSLYINFMNMSN